MTTQAVIASKTGALVSLRVGIVVFFTVGLWTARSLAVGPDLNLTGTDSPDPVTVGELLNYNLVVTNVGTSTATGVRLTNTLSPNATYFSASVSQGTFTPGGGLVVCDLGSINAGSAATIRITTTPGVAGTITNSAIVSLAQVDANPVNNSSSQATLVVPPTFYAAGNLNLGRRLHTATLLQNGKVLIAGGITSTGTTATAELYDPVANTFTFTGSMTTRRDSQTAMLLNDGRVLIAGYSEWPGGYADLYDPVTGTFTRTGSLSTPRLQGHTATLLSNDKVMIAGGYGISGWYLSTVELFDPVAGTFSSAPDMNSMRSWHTATRLTNDSILIAGGTYGSANGDVYNADASSVSLTTNSMYPSPESRASLLPDGRVLISGGNNPRIADALVFDPASGQFAVTTNMFDVRWRHTSTTLSDGTVLICGGTHGMPGDGLSSAELYFSSTGRFVRTVDMLAARDFATATRLMDGRVLVVGGMVNTPTGQVLLASAEIYDPVRTKIPPSFSVADASVLEDAGALRFDVQLSSPLGYTSSVDYATSPGTAEEGTDYIPLSGTLVFPPGSTNQSLFVPIVADLDFEEAETLSLLLSNATNALLANRQAIGTILNDDPVPTVAVASATILEPNVGTTNVSFTAYLSAKSYQAISVNYATSDGSAMAGSDYIATNGLLNFDPGVTNLTLSVLVKGDTLYESNEVFYIVLSSPTNVTIGAPGVATIISDDGLPGVLDHFTFCAITPSQYATFPIGLTVTARDASNSVVTSFNGSVLLSGNTSNAPGYLFDFEEGDFSQWTPLNLGNSPGPYQIVPFDVAGRDLPSLAFRIAANSGAADGISRPVSLLGGVTYALSVEVASMNENPYYANGDPGTAHLQINGVEVATVNFGVFGSINPGQIFRTNLVANFLAPSNGLYQLSLRFDRGYAESDVWNYADNVRVMAPPLTPTWISPFTNGVWSGNFVAGAAASNLVLHVDDGDGHFGDSAPFTVLNYADLALQTSFAPNPARVGSNLTCTVSITNLGPTAAIGVVLTNNLPPNTTFVSATATTGSCSLSNNLITCNLGMLTNAQRVTVTIVYRPSLPNTITHSVGLYSPDFDPNPANNTSTTTIPVNPPLIYILGPTVVERTGTTTNAVFQVSIGTPFVQTIDVDYATADGTATAGQDYVAASGHLTFTSAITNRTITVTVLDDLINEPAETFAMNLSNPVNVQFAFGGTTNCTILDNFDPLPLLSISDVSLVEGNSGTNNAVFNVTLSRPSGYTVQVRYATSSGTALSGSDFVTNGGTLSFPPNTTSQTITVGVRGDTVKEPDETFFVTLSNPVNALIQRAQATGNILNDDTAAGQLDHFEWSVVPSPQYANLTFPVTLTARDAFNSVFTGAIPNPVNLTVMQGTTNFAIVSPGTAGSFVSGVWSGTLSISTTLTNVVLRADDGQQRVGSSNPFDVLAQTALVLTLPAGANENAGVLTGQGKVSLPRATGGTVTVSLASSDTTEVAVPASVTVAAGQSNATFNLTVVNDAILDGTQTATITASASGYLNATAPFSVYDDETATLIVGAPASVSETAGSSSGSVTISAAPASALTVSLTSSDPARIQVPTSLSFSAGQTVKTFNITIVNDQVLQGTTNVTITAHVQNWTDGVTNLTVVDDETNNLAFQFTGAGATYPEGRLLVTNATVRLGGSVATNVTIALTSSDTNAVIVPSSVIIPAGSNSVPLNLTIVDDAVADGTQIATLTATAPGFSSATAMVSVTDNELHHFNFSAIPSPEQGSVAFAVTLTARDINDVVMSAYSGYITLTATDGVGNPVPISPASVTVLNGQWSGNLTVPTWEYQGVRITATDTDGHTSQSGAFDVIPPTVYLINLAASDLVYSETSKLIYASITNSGMLTPVNPFYATLGTPVSITNLSGRLCASDGGQYVFAALNGATNHICQFDVNSQTVVNAWALDGTYVEDMTPVLESPAAVAVSRKVLNRSPRFAGVVIYDNGIARSNINGGFLGSNVIEPSHSPDRLYGYNNETSPASFQIMKIDASGITVIGGWGTIQGFGVDISCRGGWIFATTGQIIDPERGIQVNSFGNTPVADDAASGRYYLVSAGALLAYDQNTLLPVGATALPGVTGAAGSFIRWGTNGFALRVSSSKIALLRSPLVSGGVPSDLRLTANLPLLPVTASNVLSYSLTVSNQGSNPAQNVVLTQTLPGNSSFLSATQSSGSNTLVSGGLVCSLLSIPAGGAASMTVNLQTLKPGLLAAVASVTTDSLDPNLTNNVLKLEVPVTTIPARDTVTELALPTTDLAWDKSSGRIFASAPNANWLLGNSIIALDPLTGNFDPRIPMAIEPAKVAVADNGQYLYAGINGDNSIQRVNLDSRVADLKFPTGLNYVADMAVLPGSPQAVAVTAHTTFAVYDNGVMRSNTVGPSPYNFEYYLAVSATNTLAYEAPPNELRRIAIDSSGATLLDSTGLINGFDRLIKFDAGRLYTAGGRVIDPEAEVVVTNLPYSGLACPDSQGGKVFYLTVSGSVGTLHAVKVTNFVEVGNVMIPNISGTVSSLIRWGVDGLAFRTTGGQLFLIRTTLADDRDNDGLPDSWELRYFTSISAPGAGPLDDPDHDGMNNLQEFQTGSNPLVYDSLRFLTWQMQTNGTYLMTVLGTVGQRYALLASTNLSDWVPMLNFTCTNIPTVVVDSASRNYGRRFYRIGPLSSVPPPRLVFPSAQPLSSNGLALALEGFEGISYRVEGSTNLKDWLTVTTFVSTNPVTPFRDPSATNQPWRFYRAVVP